jgi:large subunit ribosomal protein L31
MAVSLLETRRQGPGNAADSEVEMRAGIHPQYELRTFHCYGCATEWETRTTIKPTSSDGKIHLDICSNCHPFFTGKQKLVDKAGRVERFRRKYDKSEKPKAAEPEPSNS